MDIRCRYKIITAASVVACACGMATPSDACTRAVYLGPDNMVVTGRTMDWKNE